MIIKPLITEKTLSSAQATKQYTFSVDSGFTKDQIRKIVEETFGVHVKTIKTANSRGKEKRFGKKRAIAWVGHYKKAVVKLADKEKIDLFETKEKSSKPK